MAKAACDVQQERAPSAPAAADRHCLSLDGRGGGRAVEVLGDLATAGRTAVLVAVVAWPGYMPPRTAGTDVLTTVRAGDGARELRGFVASLKRVDNGVRITLLCHRCGCPDPVGHRGTGPGHGDRLAPHSVSLKNPARIVCEAAREVADVWLAGLSPSVHIDFGREPAHERTGRY
ncbi:alpha/beta hydrolase [Streptomyces sp. NPDC056921]|uniref:alpha/beta hydrolase n=1 Tax=Streptomyces sp. NPDC056921 TaxID=3345966 RepID=UPI00363E4DEA